MFLRIRKIFDNVGFTSYDKSTRYCSVACRRAASRDHRYLRDPKTTYLFQGCHPSQTDDPYNFCLSVYSLSVFDRIR